MWLADVGEQDFEEVNIGQAGANYGWQVMEGYQCYPPSSATPVPCNTAGLATPRAVYGHDGAGGCAITGGYVYHGSEMPELNGYYIYGDWCSGRVRGLDTNNAQGPNPSRRYRPAHRDLGRNQQRRARGGKLHEHDVLPGRRGDLPTEAFAVKDTNRE